MDLYYKTLSSPDFSRDVVFHENGFDYLINVPRGLLGDYFGIDYDSLYIRYSFKSANILGDITDLGINDIKNYDMTTSSSDKLFACPQYTKTWQEIVD